MQLPESKRREIRRPTTAREFGQLALWMAGTLAGIVSAVLVSRTPFFRAMQRNVARKAKRAKVYGARPTQSESLPLLAEAIVGTSRQMVCDVFGPPRSAVVHAPSTAETWYYPLQREQDMAMAIEFHDETAQHVEFFEAPTR